MIGLIFTTLLLVAAQQAPAATEVGAWLVAPAGNGSCAAVTGFGPNLMVSIREDAAGAGEFVLSDDRWRLRDGSRQAATLSWDGWKTSRPASFVARRTGGGRWVLAMATDAGFTAELARGRHFWLRVPGLAFEDDFAVPDAPQVAGAIAACIRKL